jgi:hypothetical protein
VHNISDVTQIEAHTAELLVPGPSRLEVEIAIVKFKKCKSPCSDEITTELIQAGGEILLSPIQKLIKSVWNKDKFPDQRKNSIIIPVHKRGDETGCNNYRRMSLLSTSYNILLNILLSRLSPYVDEIIRDLQCGFRRNRSNTGQISCFRQTLGKNDSRMRHYISYLCALRKPMI